MSRRDESVEVVAQKFHRSGLCDMEIETGQDAWARFNRADIARLIRAERRRAVRLVGKVLANGSPVIERWAEYGAIRAAILARPPRHAGRK